MKLKKYISYTLLTVGLVMLIVFMVFCMDLISIITPYYGVMFTTLLLGIVIYSTGYVKKITVVDKVDCSDIADVSIVSLTTVVDEEGNGYKCSSLLSDSLMVGECYNVRLSYDGEIIGIKV